MSAREELLEAIGTGDRRALERLLDEDPSLLDDALFAAAARHDADTVELLLDRGADPDARQEQGWAPLHAAAASGDETVARMLLEHGARLDVRTDDGKTPLELADERGQGRIVDWLEILGRGGGDAQPSA